MFCWYHFPFSVKDQIHKICSISCSVLASGRLRGGGGRAVFGALAGGGALVSRGRRSGWVWLGLVALKLAFEQGGSSVPTEALVGPVVIAAHGLGAAGGLVAALALELARRRQRA